MKNIIISDPTSLAALTLESLLAVQPDDFSQLELLVDQQAGGYCTSLEFMGQSTNHLGLSELEWVVTVPGFTGGYERDEDGVQACTDFIQEYVYVQLLPNMTLQDIATQVTTAIRAIEHNVFA